MTLSSTTVGCLSVPLESVHPSMVMRVVLYSLYPKSPRHHRDVHDTAALFGLRSAHSASAAALLGQNSHIWDDE